MFDFTVLSFNTSDGVSSRRIHSQSSSGRHTKVGAGSNMIHEGFGNPRVQGSTAPVTSAVR